MRAVIRPATRADFDVLTDGPRPYRVRAVAMEVDGRVLAVGGLAYLENGVVGVFMHGTDEAREYPVTLHKSGKMMMAEAERLGIRRLVAMADSNVDAAERWMLRFGFQPEQHDGATVYVWHKDS